MQSLVPLRPGKFHVVVLVPFNGELVNESKMAPSSQNNARPQGTAHFKIFFFVVTQRTTLKTFFSLCVTTVRLHNFCTIPLDSSYSIYSHHSCFSKRTSSSWNYSVSFPNFQLAFSLLLRLCFHWKLTALVSKALFYVTEWFAIFSFVQECIKNSV